MGSEISVFLWDQGSGFDMKYGIRVISVCFGSGIKILALGSVSMPHKIFGDQGSELNKNLGSGINFLVKKKTKKKKQKQKKKSRNTSKTIYHIKTLIK